MAYHIVKGMFLADITGLIMQFLVNPRQEQRAKYWKDKFVKCINSEFRFLELDTNVSSDVLGYVILSTHNERIESMYRRKYKFIMGMEFELNRLRTNNADHKYALSKLFSRIFINNENILSFNKPQRYDIIKQALS